MNWYLWFIIFLLLFVIPAMRARRRRRIRTAKRNRIKRRKGVNTMNEMIKEYIGKEVIVTDGYSTGVVGVVVRVEENWLELEEKNGNKQIVNTDYISRIKEYPRNKNGKKKAVVV